MKRPCWSKRKGALAALTLTGLASPTAGFAAETQVDKAIEFLKAACVTGGSSIDVRATGDGSLQITQGASGAVTGAVTVQRKELDGLADAASALAAQQATEMRACMKPHTDKIISTMLSDPPATQANVVSIQTSGNYFVTSEFDQVMATVSSVPDRYVSVAEISTAINIHPAKVSQYFNIASRNSLGSIYDNRFYINSKGVNYVLSRGLVK